MALPGDVIIDSSTTYSSVLDVALGAAGEQPVAATELASAPLAVRNLPYVQFTYRPDGTVHLDPSQKWCLTLINQTRATAAPANGTPAANFVTLLLDVQAGRTRVFQP